MTLRKRIILLGLLAVAGLFSTLWLQYKSIATQSRSIEAMTSNVKAVGALSLATHQLQQERGLTAIQRLTTNSQTLAEQAHHTDAMLVKLTGTDAGINRLVGTLAQLRITAVAGTMTPLAIIDNYSNLLQLLIDEMGRLSREPEAAVANSDSSAHSRLVAAKEHLGQIRATLGYWIKFRRDDTLVLNRLISQKILYDEELRKFGLEASPGVREALAMQFAGMDVENTLDTMTQIAASGRLPQALDVQTWWLMASMAMDRLKLVENFSLVTIEKKAEGALVQLQTVKRLGVASTLGIGLAIVLMVMSTAVSLLRTLDRALASMNFIAVTKNFHKRIPDDSPDEIGRISRSFNHLLEIAERLLIEKDYLANTDPLTGINNRTRFTKVFSEEADRKRRNQTPMALIVFDIDHFKHINDTYGHNVGDEVLKTLANQVSGWIRSSDFFVRWGGDEFVVLLRDDGCDTAIALGEKLRSRLEATSFPTIGSITCSFGVADWKRGYSETSFVLHADKALYRSKKEGRNRITCTQGTYESCLGRGQCVTARGCKPKPAKISETP